MPLAPVLVSSLMVLAPGPVPVQRPDVQRPSPPRDEASAPTPAPSSDPSPTAPADRGDPPASAPTPSPEPAPSPPAEPPATASADPATPLPSSAAEIGWIEGMVTDAELRGVALAGVKVSVLCSCLPRPEITVTDAEGRFVVEDLVPGVYTVVAERGGRPTERVIAVSPGQASRLSLRVAPPTTSAELERRDREATTARSMIAAGGLAEVGALLMLIAAGVENAKHECKFGLEDCPAAPRPTVTRGLGIGGGVLAVGGAVLLGVGIHRLRRLNAAIELDDRAAAIVLRGRF